MFEPRWSCAGILQSCHTHPLDAIDPAESSNSRFKQAAIRALPAILLTLSLGSSLAPGPSPPAVQVSLDVSMTSAPACYLPPLSRY